MVQLSLHDIHTKVMNSNNWEETAEKLKVHPEFLQLFIFDIQYNYKQILFEDFFQKLKNLTFEKASQYFPEFYEIKRDFDEIVTKSLERCGPEDEGPPIISPLPPALPNPLPLELLPNYLPPAESLHCSSLPSLGRHSLFAPIEYTLPLLVPTSAAPSSPEQPPHSPAKNRGRPDTLPYETIMTF